MQPIDYSIDVADPFQRAVQGYAFGDAVAQADVQRQREAQALEAAKQQQMAARQALQGYFSNPSAQSLAQALAMNPALEKQLNSGWTAMNDEQRKNTFAAKSQLLNAAQANPEAAQAWVTQRAEAYRNAGDEANAKATEAFGKLITDPRTRDFAISQLRADLFVADKEKAAALFEDNRKQELQKPAVLKAQGEAVKAAAEGDAASQTAVPRALAETTIKQIEAQYAPQRAQTEIKKLQADINNAYSQISERAGRLALDKDRLQSEMELKLYELGLKQTELDGDAKKLVNGGVANAIAAQNSAQQMLGLASKLEEIGGGSGAFSTGWEALKKAGGWQSDYTSARQEYIRLRNSQAVKSLPPGPATDKDIELALKGFPGENADATQVAQFLRGQAKLSAYEAAYNETQAEWVNQNGSLGRPKRDIEVGGVKVPKGTNFTEFAKANLQKIADTRLGEANAATIQTRPYWQYAQQPATQSGSASGLPMAP